jgi:hypothetical protein
MAESNLFGRGALLSSEPVATTKDGMRLQLARISEWLEEFSSLNGNLAQQPAYLSAGLNHHSIVLERKKVALAQELEKPDDPDG